MGFSRREAATAVSLILLVGACASLDGLATGSSGGDEPATTRGDSADGGGSNAPPRPSAPPATTPGDDSGSAKTNDGPGDACTGGACSLDDGLVAYWKLDGNANDSAGDEADLFSASPNRAPGYAPGKLGSGLFPGLGKTYLCDECAALMAPTRAALEFKSARSDDFTVSLWAKRTPSPAADDTWWSYALFDNGQVALRVVGNGASPSPAYPRLELHDGQSLLASIEDGSFDFRAAANTDVWVHLVAYRRGDTIGLVVSGRETTTQMSGSVGAASTFFLAQGSDGYPWQGTVDEFGKWDRALSRVEIDALYNDGAGRTLP